MHRQADLGACVASVQMESGKLITIIKGLKAKQFRVSRVLQATVERWLGFFPTYSSSISKNEEKTFYKLFKHLANYLVFSSI